MNAGADLAGVMLRQAESRARDAFQARRLRINDAIDEVRRGVLIDAQISAVDEPTQVLTPEDEGRLWHGIPNRSRQLLEPLAPDFDLDRSPEHAVGFERLWKLAVTPGAMALLIATPGRVNHGTGKTTDLIAAVLRLRLQRRLQLGTTGAVIISSTAARYVVATDLMAEVERSADGDEVAWLDRYTRPGVLAIDEIDKMGCADVGWRGPQRFRLFRRLIDSRYAAFDRTTLLATNFDVEEIERELGRSILERVSECGDTIICDWPPVRRRAAADGLGGGQAC